MTEASVLRRRLALLYRLDADGRMLATGEPCGLRRPPPLAHICLGRDTVVWALRGGISGAVADRLSAALRLLRAPPDLEDRSLDDRIGEVVRSVPGVGRIRSGPVYGFPEGLPPTSQVVLVGRDTGAVLLDGFADLLAELALVQPCLVRPLDGRAVSVCQTVRFNGCDREAGVDTLTTFRGRGYGTEVVAAWGREVRRRGLVPTYSASWDNRGSLGIARKLSLVQFAVDVEIERADEQPTAGLRERGSRSV